MDASATRRSQLKGEAQGGNTRFGILRVLNTAAFIILVDEITACTNMLLLFFPTLRLTVAADVASWTLLLSGVGYLRHLATLRLSCPHASAARRWWIHSLLSWPLAFLWTIPPVAAQHLDPTLFPPCSSNLLKALALTV